MKNIFYFSLKYLLRYYNQIFFRKIKIYGYGNIPKDGGVLFSPNHQGAFLDPLLIGSMTPNKITSLTRSDVFGGPLQWFMDALQMLPVYRIRNGYSNLKKNNVTFNKCYKILGSGKFLLMFSEGSHHDEYFLQKLSKGSSRLAYQAQISYPNKKIYILPVGLNYGHHRQVRCSLHLVFGKAIEVKSRINDKHSDAENINAIREDLQKSMRDCLWLPEESENYRLKKECINRITTKMEFYTLRQMLENSLTKLPKRRELSPIRALAINFLSLPNIIPFWITRFIIGKVKDVVFISSIKYAMGVFFFPIWWFITAIPIFYLYGTGYMTIYLLISISSIFARQRIILS